MERRRKAMETSVRIAGVPVEIRTEHFLNENLQRCG
jgi:hypothetical protein